MYDHLTTFLLNNGFLRWGDDKTLFVPRIQGEVLGSQVYIDNIIFSSTKDDLT